MGMCWIFFTSFFLLFKKFLADTYTCPTLGPLVPLFWISGFQARFDMCWTFCRLDLTGRTRSGVTHSLLVAQEKVNRGRHQGGTAGTEVALTDLDIRYLAQALIGAGTYLDTTLFFRRRDWGIMGVEVGCWKTIDRHISVPGAIKSMMFP